MKENKEWKERISFLDNDEYGIEIVIDGKRAGVFDEYKKMVLDFIESEKEKSYKEGWVKALEIDGDVKNGREYVQGFSDCYELYYKELLQTEKADKLKKKMSKLLKKKR